MNRVARIAAWLRTNPPVSVLLFFVLAGSSIPLGMTVGGILGFFISWALLTAAIMLSIAWFRGGSYS